VSLPNRYLTFDRLRTNGGRYCVIARSDNDEAISQRLEIALSLTLRAMTERQPCPRPAMMNIKKKWNARLQPGGADEGSRVHQAEAWRSI